MAAWGQIVGKRLVAWRKRLGLTQIKLSAMSGISQGSTARIEGGYADDVQTSTLVALAQAFGVTPDYLLGFVDDDEEEQPRRRRGMSRATT